MADLHPRLDRFPRDPLGSSDNKWHLDKRVPLGIILALVAHSALGIWFSAKLDSRLSQVEEFVGENKTNDRRLAVIESRLGSIDATLERIDRKLDAPLSNRRGEVRDPPPRL